MKKTNIKNIDIINKNNQVNLNNYTQHTKVYPRLTQYGCDNTQITYKNYKLKITKNQIDNSKTKIAKED